MAVKHKVLKDFQLLTNDKKIITLKAKTILEDYKYSTKNDNVLVEKDIVDNNPDYFSIIDWKEELNTYLRQNKMPQPAVLTKKLVPFIEEMFVINQKNEVKEVIREVVKEIPTSDIEKEIELESKIQKNKILEEHLKLEIEKLNSNIFELKRKEKQLNDLEIELNQKSELLKKLELDLSEKELSITQKDSNLSNLIEKSVVIQRITNTLNNLQNNGFQIRHFNGQEMNFIDIISKINI